MQRCRLLSDSTHRLAALSCRCSTPRRVIRSARPILSLVDSPGDGSGSSTSTSATERAERSVWEIGVGNAALRKLRVVGCGAGQARASCNNRIGTLMPVEPRLGMWPRRKRNGWARGGWCLDGTGSPVGIHTANEPRARTPLSAETRQGRARPETSSKHSAAVSSMAGTDRRGKAESVAWATSKRMPGPFGTTTPQQPKDSRWARVGL